MIINEKLDPLLNDMINDEIKEEERAEEVKEAINLLHMALVINAIKSNMKVIVNGVRVDLRHYDY